MVSFHFRFAIPMRREVAIVLLPSLVACFSPPTLVADGLRGVHPHIMRATPAQSNLLDTFNNNMKQMTDQRVVRISHVMLRADPSALNVRTKGECYELLSAWKEVICDDSREGTILERFEICARERSECASKDKSGELGYFTRGKLSKEFAEVCFSEEPGNVYGPIVTDGGMHLLFLHSCREPDTSGKAKMPWEQS